MLLDVILTDFVREMFLNNIHLLNSITSSLMGKKMVIPIIILALLCQSRLQIAFCVLSPALAVPTINTLLSPTEMVGPVFG